METENKRDRRIRIENAAYHVLQNKGYKGASMLAIAQEAGCSNETLYRWYGNKQALFSSLVESSAATIANEIRQSIQADGDTIEELRIIGPLLLEMVTSRKAVALNRAAAGDVYHTKTLGPAIAAGGKETIAPLLTELISSGISRKMLRSENPTEIASIFLSVLIGDTQIQRAIGVIPELSEVEKENRTDKACAVIQRLYVP